LAPNTQPVHALLALAEKGALILARSWPEHLADAQQIMLKDSAMDAADAALISVAERSPQPDLVTTDRRDFELCRGLRNRSLKLLLPGARNLESIISQQAISDCLVEGVAVTHVGPEQHRIGAAAMRPR
jgi:hypothetical protein